MTWRPGLPGVLGDIAEAAGEAAAVTLCRAQGGREIVIPVRPAGSQLAGIVGIDAAERIVAALGPGRVRLPVGAYRGQGGKRRLGMEMLAAGASSADVAERADVALRTVEKWRASMRRASNQISLPWGED